ncbi:hypothetical protein [Arthrobacter sp. 31Y]|nr:hypothetical protein [Arthrobacter sp. 31Y]
MAYLNLSLNKSNGTAVTASVEINDAAATVLAEAITLAIHNSLDEPTP